MKQSHSSQKPDWAHALQSPPVEEPGFTDEMAVSVMERSRSLSVPSSRRRPFFRIAAATLGGIILIAGLWAAAPLFHPDGARNPVHRQGAAPETDWTPRQQINNNDGTLKLEMFLGGDHTAGIPAGGMWMLHTPTQDLIGQTVQITAIHKETGMTIDELPPTEITEEMKYFNKTRLVSRFGLPLPGLWRFEVTVDGQRIGAPVADIPDGSWTPSPSFTSGSYQMTGTPGRLGFIDPGFQAGQGNKYMWHFWGRDEELTGELAITAVKKDSTDVIDIFHASLRPGQHNGADASLPTTMSLPSPGLWRIMVSIDGQLFGSVVVEVN